MLTAFLFELSSLENILGRILAHMNYVDNRNDSDALDAMDISETIDRDSNLRFSTENDFDEDGTFWCDLYVDDINYRTIFKQKILWQDLGF